MSHDHDYLLALEMQKKWNEGSSDELILENTPQKKQKVLKRTANGKYRSNLDDDYLNRTNNLVHPQWETLDPTPDTQAMFHAFDDKFFQKRLRCVTLEWSKRMYSCAGICYSRKNGLGMSITIRLSEPLLKLRSRKDLVETMLHEMIHAYCFVLGIREGNGGHGPNFVKIMKGINQVAGTNITVYHTFRDEVNVYKTHWWRCNGVCQHRSPFYGYVKRTNNRAPGPNDIWWSQHHHSCGGTFMKIKEPEPVKKSKSKPKAIEANLVKGPAKSNGADLRTFFPSSGASGHGGPIKTNGSGTLLLNPKTSSTIPVISSDTPRFKGSERKLTSGNLPNVVGFKDLEDGKSPSRTPVTRFSMAGTGYTLATSNSGEPAEKPVDRDHLRDLRLRRYGCISENTYQQPQARKDGTTKRRRLSSQLDNDANSVANESSPKLEWTAIDEDIMVHDVEFDVIAISSSDDDDDHSDIGCHTSTPRKAMVFADADARHKEIKKEILNESNDLSTGVEDDINLIDDEYNDDALCTSVDLADTSIVDDLFGEDTLLKEFKRENAVAPSCSRYSDDPGNDIITCPICQEKLKRENFSDHLDGCVGITVKIELPKFAKGKLPTLSQPKKTSHAKPQSRAKEILMSAGYTEEDLKNITEADTGLASSPTNDVDLNLSDRQRRTKSLYSQTRSCPVCCCEVELDKINDHLDECLSTSQ